MELEIYSWSESHRPFAKLGLSSALIQELNENLRRLRREVDAEIEARLAG